MRGHPYQRRIPDESIVIFKTTSREESEDSSDDPPPQLTSLSLEEILDEKPSGILIAPEREEKTLKSPEYEANPNLGYVDKIYDKSSFPKFVEFDDYICDIESSAEYDFNKEDEFEKLKSIRVNEDDDSFEGNFAPQFEIVAGNVAAEHEFG